MHYRSYVFVVVLMGFFVGFCLCFCMGFFLMFKNAFFPFKPNGFSYPYKMDESIQYEVWWRLIRVCIVFPCPIK